MTDDELEGFADPWEHIRLLSDRGRNDILLNMLRRLAPGRRVLEVGCGTGLLSCVAARLGAAAVIAVEPTRRVVDARALVAQNGLEAQVSVRQGRVEDLEPEPVDLAFSELLNADPFTEGILPAMDAAAAWLAPGGVLSPAHLRIWIAAVQPIPSRSESAAALAEIRRIAGKLGIDVNPIATAVGDVGVYRYLDDVERLAGPPQILWEAPLGRGWRPPERDRRTLPVGPGGPAGGAVVWFEAEVEPGIWLDNGPGHGGHWGQLVCGWSEPGPPGDVEVVVKMVDDELTVIPA